MTWLTDWVASWLTFPLFWLSRAFFNATCQISQTCALPFSVSTFRWPSPSLFNAPGPLGVSQGAWQPLTERMMEWCQKLISTQSKLESTLIVNVCTQQWHWKAHWWDGLFVSKLYTWWTVGFLMHKLNVHFVCFAQGIYIFNINHLLMFLSLFNSN